jgi:hypothetical protein
MREGIGFDKTEYYLKTDKGLWLKGWVDLASGTINIAHQNRLVFTNDRTIAVLNESGDPTGLLSMSNTELPDEWTLCASVSLDGSSWGRFLLLAEKHGHDGAALHHRILVHAIRLGASGWGESLGEPLSWFADPFATPFIVHDRYRVDIGCGAFDGLEGLVFEPDFDEDEWSKCVENTVTCGLFYDGRKVELEASVFDLVYFCSPAFNSA